MSIIAFGIGINFFSYVERLDTVMKIDCFSDNDCKKWNKYTMGDERICIAPEEIKELDEPFVIIMAEREGSKVAIEKQFDDMNVPHVRIDEVLSKAKLKPIKADWPQKIQNTRIHKFIELLVHGTTECNFHCEYCYVWRKNDFHSGIESSDYTPQDIRKAFSVKRLGGICHINVCALGETLLAKNIEKIIYELADEGHYISIITNGTITSKVDKILEFPKSVQERLFFKFSFHYLELERTKLFEKFWSNVHKVRDSYCSYSIEITPSDLILDRFDDIRREFEEHENGAMPHITFTRDAKKEDLDLYSNLSLEEYKEKWGVFDSELFNLKAELYKKRITENCYAGCWSYRVNLLNGNLQSCYQQEVKGSIFENTEGNLPIRTVKSHCAMNYCFNNHAFIAWGDVPELECANYLAMRDREDSGSRRWVKAPYRAIMSQKLYDNNFLYIGRWDDYEKLYAENRKPAFVLFNSPDYGNLGDHAIAYAEREFFKNVFPEKEFIEISSEQYLKENISISNAILSQDILVISGGGYIGSVWPWLEDLTLNIIKRFPDNKIIIMPQTVYFEDSVYGNYEKDLFVQAIKRHKNLIFMTRDKMSFQIVKSWNIDSIEDILYCPDMVLSLSLEQYKKQHKGNDIMICLRDDKEVGNINFDGINQKLKDIFEKTVQISTVVDYDINLNNRKRELEKLWEKMTNAKIVITDRLHAVIFSYLLGIPCIAFNNKTGKVFEFVDSVEKISKIYKCDSEDKMDDIIKKISEERLTVTNKFETNFIALGEYLKGKCFI